MKSLLLAVALVGSHVTKLPSAQPVPLADGDDCDSDREPPDPPDPPEPPDSDQTQGSTDDDSSSD